MGGDRLGGLVVVILAAVMGMVALPAVALLFVSQRLSRGKSGGLRLEMVFGSLLPKLALHGHKRCAGCTGVRQAVVLQRT